MLSSAPRQGSKNNGRYKAALIGCGGIGFSYDFNRKVDGALTHFSAFTNSSAFDLVAVCDTRKEVQEIISNQYGIASFGTYQEMFDSIGSVDVVIVATPDQTHEEILNNLIDFQPRLVFAEKPVALSRDTLFEILKVYKKSQIGLQVNFYRRFTQAFQDIKTRLSAKEFGEVHSVQIYYSRGFYHNCCHFVDVVRWFFGSPKDVFIESTRPGLAADDPTLSLLCLYPDGLEIRFVGLNTSKVLTYEMDIFAEAGRIRILHSGTVEIYRISQHETWPDFEQYELSEEIPINFAAAMPQAVENISSWLAGNQALMSPGDNSDFTFQLIEQAKDITV